MFGSKKAVGREKSDLFANALIDRPVYVRTYHTAVVCTNCGYRGTEEVETGKSVCGSNCPRCKCDYLKHDEARSW